VRNEKEAVVKKARSSSKNARDASLDKTVKRYDGSDDTAVPAWYKVLKKNLN